jgi:hypothetical protein
VEEVVRSVDKAEGDESDEDLSDGSHRERSPTLFAEFA